MGSLAQRADGRLDPLTMNIKTETPAFNMQASLFTMRMQFNASAVKAC